MANIRQLISEKDQLSAAPGLSKTAMHRRTSPWGFSLATEKNIRLTICILPA
jgi:hypothetical protein